MGTPDTAGRAELEGLGRRAADLDRAGGWGEETMELDTTIEKLDPTDAAARFWRGRCHRRRADLQSAQADHRRAREPTRAGSAILSHDDRAIADVRREIRDRALRELEVRRGTLAGRGTEGSRRPAFLWAVRRFGVAYGPPRRPGATGTEGHYSRPCQARKRDEHHHCVGRG